LLAVARNAGLLNSADEAVIAVELSKPLK